MPGAVGEPISGVRRKDPGVVHYNDLRVCRFGADALVHTGKLFRERSNLFVDLAAVLATVVLGEALAEDRAKADVVAPNRDRDDLGVAGDVLDLPEHVGRRRAVTCERGLRGEGEPRRQEL